MLTKIALLSCLFAQDESDAPVPPIEPPPLFGPYTQDTADRYEVEAQLNMVWISFDEKTYSDIYYDGDTKKDLQETDATSVSSVFGPRMLQLAAEIEKAVGKKYHIVFFDSKEYKDHAVEGLNCKVETDNCISVLKPMGHQDLKEEPDEEVVYTKPLPGKLSHTDESQMQFIIDFVKLVEAPGPEKDEYKFSPSFDDDEPVPEEDGFGSDEEPEI